MGKAEIIQNPHLGMQLFPINRDTGFQPVNMRLHPEHGTWLRREKQAHVKTFRLFGTYLFLLSHLLLGLGHDLLLLGEDHLDVAGRAHVGVDAAVGAVGAPAHFGGLVHLDVLDHQGVHIQALWAHRTLT